MSSERIADARPPRVTDLIEELRCSLPGPRVTLGDCVSVLRERAFGSFMLILSLPNILPLPWGAATILGIPMVLIASQMMLGRRALWLPGWLLRLGADQAVVAKVLDRALPRLRRMERWLRPRVAVLSSAPAERVIGALCIFLCFVLVLPVPLLGWFPAFALVALSLGLVERDGAVLLVGFGLCVLSACAALVALAGIAAAGDALIPGLTLDVPFLDAG
jgi:hypothetical protein